MTPSPPPPVRNRLLAGLPAAEAARLRPRLELVPLGVGEVIYAPQQLIPYVYFPERGVSSILVTMADGRVSEVGTVGREGMLGLPVFLGAETSPGRSLSQIAGEAWRMAAAAFREEIPRAATLQGRLLRYTQALFTQVAQSAACNHLHPLIQRCSRWLLLIQDRAGGEELRLTHGFLSAMLGVRRASVTEALGRLHRAGLIRRRRGRITVVDRPGLEAAACECYRLIAAEDRRLLGPWPA